MRRTRKLSQGSARGEQPRLDNTTLQISKEVLESLPEDVRLSVMQAAAFSGPLPPPSMYHQYEAVLEGSADRILSMAEVEQKHRIDWEAKALNAASGETVRGQWLGLFVVIICLGSTVYLSANGNQ